MGIKSQMVVTRRALSRSLARPVVSTKMVTVLSRRNTHGRSALPSNDQLTRKKCNADGALILRTIWDFNEVLNLTPGGAVLLIDGGYNDKLEEVVDVDKNNTRAIFYHSSCHTMNSLVHERKRKRWYNVSKSNVSYQKNTDNH